MKTDQTGRMPRLISFCWAHDILLDQFIGMCTQVTLTACVMQLFVHYILFVCIMCSYATCELPVFILNKVMLCSVLFYRCRVQTNPEI